MSKRITVAGLLITLGSGALTIVALRAQIDKTVWTISDPLYLFFLPGGLICIVIGLVIIIVILPLHAILNAIKTFVNTRLRSPRFACRPANSSELEELLRFGRSFFGDDIADIDKIKEWHAKNPSLFYLVHKVSKRQGKTTERLVGFFDVIPVTKKTASLLEDEKLNGTTFKAEHIVKPNGSAAAIYVAAVAANGLGAKAWVLGKLEAYVEKHRNKGLPVYTRPVTKRGLQLAKQYDFTPVSTRTGDDELLRVYKLNPNAQPQKRRRRSVTLKKSCDNSSPRTRSLLAFSYYQKVAPVRLMCFSLLCFLLLKKIRNCGMEVQRAKGKGEGGERIALAFGLALSYAFSALTLRRELKNGAPRSRPLVTLLSAEALHARCDRQTNQL